jgi:hypothetical protein
MRTKMSLKYSTMRKRTGSRRSRCRVSFGVSKILG